MTASCQRHNAHWTGHRTEHCCACGETFTGTTAGDMHRVGDHAISVGPDRRRCLRLFEMVDKGMKFTVNAHGTRIWNTGRTQDTPFYVSQDGPGLRTAHPEGDSLTPVLEGAQRNG